MSNYRIAIKENTFLKILFVSAFIFLLQNTSSGSVDDYDGYFLLESPDARGSALMNGGTVFAAGATSSYYNPANLAGLDNWSSTMFHSGVRMYYNSLDNYYLAKNINRRLFLGFGIDHYKTRRGYHLNGDYIAKYSKDWAVSINCAYKINSFLSAGLKMKYLHFNTHLVQFYLGTSLYRSIVFDFGISAKNIFPKYTLPFNSNSTADSNGNFRGFSAGLAILNIEAGDNLFGDRKYSTFPKQLLLATGYQLCDFRHLQARVAFDFRTFLFDFSGKTYGTSKRSVNYSCEITFFNTFTLRGSCLNKLDDKKYRRIDGEDLYIDDTSLDYGGGFGIKIKWLQINCAYNNEFEGGYFDNDYYLMSVRFDL